MPSTIVYLLLAPVLLLVSFPLVIFAALTSSLAFTTLLIRVGIVYLELFLSITQNYFISTTGTGHDSQRTTTTKDSASTTATGTTSSSYKNQYNKRQPCSLYSFSSRRTSINSTSNSTTTIRSPPKSPRSPNLPPPSPTANFVYNHPNSNNTTINNLPSPSLPTTERDFEGVGGWLLKDPGSDSDGSESIWSSINSRLELPAGGIGTGSLTGYSTPELRRKKRRGTIIGEEQQHQQQQPQASQQYQPKHRRSLPGGSAGGLGLGLAGGGRRLGFKTPEKLSMARTPEVEMGNGDPMDGVEVTRASKSYITLANGMGMGMKKDNKSKSYVSLADARRWSTWKG